VYHLRADAYWALGAYDAAAEVGGLGGVGRGGMWYYGAGGQASGQHGCQQAFAIAVLIAPQPPTPPLRSASLCLAALCRT
jgi:hypothetical protein